MYDLIIVKPKLNKRKVAICILIFIFIILAIIAVNKLKQDNQVKECSVALEDKAEQFIKQQENERLAQEEIKKQEETRMQKLNSIYESDHGKRAFLTFDDGPSQTVTPLILDLLKKENIKATFFLLGSRVEKNPELVKREFEEGHYIANHGYSHVYKEIYISSETTFEEYTKTEKAIQNALQNPNYNSRLFRFPGGSSGGYYSEIKNQAKQLFKQNGVSYLDWNALTQDSAGAHTKEKILENLKQTVGQKESVVILMHDAADKILTYETLPDVIAYLKEQGYQFECLYDIIGETKK